MNNLNEATYSVNASSAIDFEIMACVDMVKIPAGRFMMGSSHGGEFERPEHEVILEDYWMDEALVTNKDFEQFVNQTSYVTTAENKGTAWGYRDGQYSDIKNLCWRSFAGQGREDHPVIVVSWHDATAYAEWRGKRLPTEAEWEKAARGGLVCKSYPWGENEPTPDNCGFADKLTSEVPATVEVRMHQPNGFGLYGMVGHVWQWCSDWYKEDYYAQSPINDPKGTDTGTLKVRRGGSWNVRQEFRLRCANRGAINPEAAFPNIGFRCAMSCSK